MDSKYVAFWFYSFCIHKGVTSDGDVPFGKLKYMHVFNFGLLLFFSNVPFQIYPGSVDSSHKLSVASH